MNEPQKNAISAPIVHTLSDVYVQLYQIGKKISKRDRFGIFLEAERGVLTSLRLSVRAALQVKGEKLPTVKELRIEIDIAKRLVRMMHELKIIEEKPYFCLQEKLIECSKMAAGWLSYIVSAVYKL